MESHLILNIINQLREVESNLPENSEDQIKIRQCIIQLERGLMEIDNKSNIAKRDRLFKVLAFGLKFIYEYFSDS